jgi:hypothetical protein
VRGPIVPSGRTVASIPAGRIPEDVPDGVEALFPYTCTRPGIAVCSISSRTLRCEGVSFIVLDISEPVGLPNGYLCAQGKGKLRFTLFDLLKGVDYDPSLLTHHKAYGHTSRGSLEYAIAGDRPPRGALLSARYDERTFF